MSSREMLRDLIAEYGQFKVEQREERSRLYERNRRLAAQVAALRAALEMQKSWGLNDGPCFCRRPPEDGGLHRPWCEEARAALANPDAAAARATNGSGRGGGGT